MHKPLAHLLTFRTYGTWLPGAAQGYVTRQHNAYGSLYVPGEEALYSMMRARLRAPPLHLTPVMQSICRQSFVATCRYRQWQLHESVVVATHCHLVVTLLEASRDAIGELKSYATRELRLYGLIAPQRPVWGRCGSGLLLFDERAVYTAMAYVARHRGPSAW